MGRRATFVMTNKGRVEESDCEGSSEGGLCVCVVGGGGVKLYEDRVEIWERWGTRHQKVAQGFREREKSVGFGGSAKRKCISRWGEEQQVHHDGECKGGGGKPVRGFRGGGTWWVVRPPGGPVVSATGQSMGRAKEGQGEVVKVGGYMKKSRRGCQGGHLEGCKAAKVSAPGQSMGRARDVRSGVVRGLLIVQGVHG